MYHLLCESLFKNISLHVLCPSLSTLKASVCVLAKLFTKKKFRTRFVFFGLFITKTDFYTNRKKPKKRRLFEGKYEILIGLKQTFKKKQKFKTLKV